MPNKKGAHMQSNKHQKGEVSLFVVIFTTLLITVVTVGFIRIMIQGQQQATSTDLSQSAYDSAQVGVEDGKRAILRYMNICSTGTQAECDLAKADLDSLVCNNAVRKLSDVDSVSSDAEVKVQQSSSINDLDQAYTCTKIQMDTIDVSGYLEKDGAKIIPLVGLSAFNKVKVEWFMSSDFSSTFANVSFHPMSASIPPPLISAGNWPTNRPPVLRTQLAQFNPTGFNLSGFDNGGVGNSNANTLFLYPSSAGLPTMDFAANDVRRGVNPPPVPGAPKPTRCVNLSGSAVYSCSVVLTLPNVVDVSSNGPTAILRLKAIYNSTSFRVSLFDNSDTSVKFKGVQPMIDSTGRANDLFRRVQARVESIDPNFPYPDGAVQTTGNLCKDFFVTNSPDDYSNSCTP
ncbi:hypothetical protein HGB25_01595 [Candidatus Saccharibacteria bacterium]|nr:hypothetical protein [Candidatus Saccharibacteria bacterium]